MTRPAGACGPPSLVTAQARRARPLAGIVVIVAVAVVVGGCGGGGSDVPGGDVQLGEGRRVYREYCASCHGADGGGGVGPKLGGGAVVDRYPEVADQRAVVERGRAGMPGWRGTLSPAEIDAVVRYERELLGR